MDPYQILGIDKNSNRGTIREAYRRQAIKHHPDNGGDASGFQQIQEAYRQLTQRTQRLPPLLVSASDTQSGRKAKKLTTRMAGAVAGLLSAILAVCLAVWLLL